MRLNNPPSPGEMEVDTAKSRHDEALENDATALKKLKNINGDKLTDNTEDSSDAPVCNGKSSPNAKDNDDEVEDNENSDSEDSRDSGADKCNGNGNGDASHDGKDEDEEKKETDSVKNEDEEEMECEEENDDEKEADGGEEKVTDDKEEDVKESDEGDDDAKSEKSKDEADADDAEKEKEEKDESEKVEESEKEKGDKEKDNEGEGEDSKKDDGKKEEKDKNDKTDKDNAESDVSASVSKEGTPAPSESGADTPGATPSATPCDTPKAGTPVPPEAEKEPEKEAKYKMFEQCGTDTEDMRPMAKLLYSLGADLCKQFIYKDLIRVQEKKKATNRLNEREGEQLDKLKGVYDVLVKKNEPYKVSVDSCDRCAFKSDSDNVIEWHKEFAHDQESGNFKCSYCDFESRQPGQFFFHMESVHNRKGRIYMRASFFNCPMCPFENTTRHALKKHLLKCEKTFNLKRNLEPAPTDCDIPLKKLKQVPPKKPVVPPPRPQPQQLPAAAAKPLPTIRPAAPVQTSKPSLPQSPFVPRPNMSAALTAAYQQQAARMAGVQQGLPMANASGVMQPTYNIGNSVFTLVNNAGQFMLQPVAAGAAGAAAIPGYPLPGQTTGRGGVLPGTQVLPGQSPVVNFPTPEARQQASKQQPTRQMPSRSTPQKPVQKVPQKAPQIPAKSPKINSKSQFEICEICGGFVKDRESLRIHFYWAHKVDINKEIFERKEPHLACTVCPQRFWTYQGYRWHQRMKHTNENSQKAKFFCAVCRSHQISNLLLHLYTSHKISIDMVCEQRRCPMCGVTFKNQANTRMHLYNCHKDMFRDIPVLEQQIKQGVSQATPSPSAPPPKPANANPVPTGLFENAASVATTKKKFEPVCSICDLTFPNLDAFTAHCTQMHLYNCHRCGKQWSTAEMLQEHFNVVHRNEMERCPICAEQVTIGRPYIRHMRRDHLRECSVKIQRLNPVLYKHYQEKYIREARELKEKVAAAVLPLLQKHRQAMPPRKLSASRDDDVVMIDDGKEKEPRVKSRPGPASSKRPIEELEQRRVSSQRPGPASSKRAVRGAGSVLERIAAQRAAAAEAQLKQEESKKKEKQLQKEREKAEVAEEKEEKADEKKLDSTNGEVMEIDGETFVIQKQSDDDDDDDDEDDE